jgi:hypothetical protein
LRNICKKTEGFTIKDAVSSNLHRATMESDDDALLHFVALRIAFVHEGGLLYKHGRIG